MSETQEASQASSGPGLAGRGYRKVREGLVVSEWTATATKDGKKLEWDAQNMKAVGCPEADALLHREYRKGWSL